jgi:hypothetical protein
MLLLPSLLDVDSIIEHTIVFLPTFDNIHEKERQVEGLHTITFCLVTTYPLAKLDKLFFQVILFNLILP